MPDNHPSYAGRPGICRNCGALVGAGETSCQMCGAPARPTPPPALPLHERYAMNFARAVLGRPYFFTIVFIVANLFIFLLMWSASGTSSSVLWTGFPEGVLLDFGAKKNYYIFYEHEYWRLVTPIFIHVNLPHILINMYSLWVIGPWVEKLYGSAKFVVFWVVTGIAGVVASYLTVVEGSHPGLIASFLIKRSDEPSAGASGALFGLVGVLFVFGIKYRHELPEGFKRAFGTGMLPVILLNLGIGFMARGVIDNAAHMGGLLSGAAFAAVVSYKRPGASTGVAVAWRVLQVAALLLVVICFGFAARASQRTPASSENRGSRTGGRTGAFDENYRAIYAGESAGVNALRTGDISGVDAAIAQLDKAERFNDESEALRVELKATLSRIVKYVHDWGLPRKMTSEGVAERGKLVTDFKQWQKRFRDWLRAGGIEEQEPGPTK